MALCVRRAGRHRERPGCRKGRENPMGRKTAHGFGRPSGPEHRKGRAAPGAWADLKNPASGRAMAQTPGTVQPETAVRRRIRSAGRLFCHLVWNAGGCGFASGFPVQLSCSWGAAGLLSVSGPVIWRASGFAALHPVFLPGATAPGPPEAPRRTESPTPGPPDGRGDSRKER